MCNAIFIVFVFVLTFVSLRDQFNRRLLHSQLNSYLLCMSYSDGEVWAGDITGKLHSFSMRDGTLKAMSQIDVGHTALITGIHRSPGGLYTCSSDRTVKVLFGTFFSFFLLLHCCISGCFFSLLPPTVFQVHIPCGPPRTLCTLQHHVAVLGVSIGVHFHIISNAKPLKVHVSERCILLYMLLLNRRKRI